MGYSERLLLFNIGADDTPEGEVVFVLDLKLLLDTVLPEVGDVFVDRYGNEYISTSAQFRIYGGDETWNTSKKYHIKGQSGTFYRKIK